MSKIYASIFYKLLVINILYYNWGVAQAHVVESEIRRAVEESHRFQKVEIFREAFIAPGNNFHHLGARELTLMSVDLRVLDALLKDRPGFLQLELLDPVLGTVQLLLKRHEIEGPDSKVITSDGRDIPLSGALFYRGIVEGVEGSLAAFSFFQAEVMGVISTPRKGNAVVGKLLHGGGTQDSERAYAYYYESALLGNLNFQCGSAALAAEQLPVQLLPPETIFPNRCKTTRIYLECDYKLYTDFNRSIQQTENYIRGLFNVVKTLYYRDSMNIEISNIFIWTGQDPFLHTDLQSILTHYSAYRRDNFTGNLAQLVTTYAPQQQGGIAWLGSVCQPYNGLSGPHSFAYIHRNYNQLPTYSWSVMVMAHELGHNLGSPHTHACSWGPNRNAALDNCAQTEGGCAPGPQPTNGGTIMSYCHLVAGVGINFSNGFGAEPGALIRSRVNQASCIMPSFTATLVSPTNRPFLEGDRITLKARPYAANYTYDWFHYDYRIPNARDTFFNVPYSGIYRAAVSDNCTEYTASDTIQLADFLVNLGCPRIPGRRDSAVAELSINADQALVSDSLIFPDSLYHKIPAKARDVLVELHHTIEPKGTSWIRDVQMTYSSPAPIGITNARYHPNSNEPPSNKSPKTYKRILGNFNPGGKWHFTVQDVRFDPGIDAVVTIRVVLSWRMKDSVASCDIPICGNDSLLLDAGIAGGSYQWSNGARTKTIKTATEGPVSVQVTKNNRTSRHEVNLVKVPVQFYQSFTLCEGEWLDVGNNRYSEEGLYTDSLASRNGCDSIVHTAVHILKKPLSSDTLPLCYGEEYEGFKHTKDTALQYTLRGSNGCDSIHTRWLAVNPEINFSAEVEPYCENVGGKIRIFPSGGKGTLTLRWDHGDTSATLEGINSGKYSFLLTDESQCIRRGEATLQNHDSISIVDQVEEILCFGGNDGQIRIAIVTGTAPFAITWSNGQNTSDISQLARGQYTVFIRDGTGCQFTKTYELTEPDPLIAILDSQPSDGQDGKVSTRVFGGTPPYTYRWNTGATASSVDSLPPGTYSVTVTDAHGCTVSQTAIVQQKVASNNLIRNATPSVYPNPVEDYLIVAIPNGTACQELVVYQPFGKEYFKRKINSWEKTIRIDVKNYLPGMYYVVIKNADNGHLPPIAFIKM